MSQIQSSILRQSLKNNISRGLNGKEIIARGKIGDGDGYSQIVGIGIDLL
jgi:hypothetical protein